ncbi:MAG TPA: HlyD family secretion protein, partial [Sphingomicrobium sp.]|nr:HlyD family secretion protein [Sphingomicrobium sp.]
EVAGDVIAVGAKENTHVRKGQMLFRIDPEPYRIAVQSAEGNLAAALQDAQVSEADVVASKALLNKQRVDLDASHKLGKIVTDLVAEHALPKTNGIRAEADIAETQADVAKAEADVRRAEANLGSPGASNAKVRQAIAALDQARLDLQRTTVVATGDGVVTNLRLAPGQYVTTGQPLLSFLADGPRWISANLRENQLGNVAPGEEVLVALDVDPGKLFKGRVHSIGWGIKQGDEAPTGQLADVPPDQGWLREPQRFPVRVQLLVDSDRTAPGAGRSGAQANVIVFTSRHSLLNPIGRVWIWTITMLSYLQ